MTADEVRFQTLETVTLAAGQVFIEAPAEAIESGSFGNVVAGEVCILTACPVAVTGCTNPTAFSGGRNEEDDTSFRARILDSYRRLPNGANAAWYEQTAESYPGVAAAAVIGRARGIGTVDVYVTEESGLPTESLLAELQEKREIAVDVAVKAPETEAVDVVLTVSSAENVAFEHVKETVEKEIMSYFNGRLLGRPVLLADLGNRIYSLEGVENYRFTAPASDVPANPTVLPVLGTLSIKQMEA